MREPRAALGVSLFERFGRIWLLAGAIIVAGSPAAAADGLAAALIIFGAYTIPFVIGLVSGPPPASPTTPILDHPERVMSATTPDVTASGTDSNGRLARSSCGGSAPSGWPGSSSSSRSSASAPHKAPSVASGVVLADRRVQARHLVQRRPDRVQQGRAVPDPGGGHHDRADVLHRPPAEGSDRAACRCAVEMFYDLTSNLADGSMDKSMSRKYFPLIATIFIFILVSNLIGYIPLPINTGQKFQLFGVHCRRSRSTPPTRTSRSRWSSRCWCSSCSPTRASASTVRSATSRA